MLSSAALSSAAHVASLVEPVVVCEAAVVVVGFHGALGPFDPAERHSCRSWPPNDGPSCCWLCGRLDLLVLG